MPTSFSGRTLTASLLLAAACVTPAAAQDSSGLTKHLTLLGIPSATTAPHGSFFASLAYSTKRVATRDNDGDGSLALGFGLGDMNEGIGFQVTAEIVSLTDSFADSGYFDLKAATRITEGRTPLYLGASVGNIAPWGDAENNDVNVDVALTGFHLFETGSTIPTPIMFTVGYGTDLRDSYTKPGFFAGIGVGLTPSLAASVSWFGEYGTLGVSWSPPTRRNLSVTASLVDFTDELGDRRGVFSINYLFPKAFGG